MKFVVTLYIGSLAFDLLVIYDVFIKHNIQNLRTYHTPNSQQMGLSIHQLKTLITNINLLYIYGNIIILSYTYSIRVSI